MSIFNRFFKPGESDAPEDPDDSQEKSLAPLTPDELMRLEGASSKSISFPLEGKAAAAADSLIPLAANVTQAAQQYGMAVVKFPEGVGWGDLCVRRSDGLNLLSSFGNDGKFNDMAAIKQAGLQPIAAANLALQGAAIVVGMAYMNQINNRLDRLESTVRDIQRNMELQRQAELKAAYDSLVRLTFKFNEYAANPEKRQAAQLVIERAIFEADKAWNFHIARIKDFSHEVAVAKRLSAKQIESKSRRLNSLENRAAAAFRIHNAARQIGMRLDGDYSEENIEKERQLSAKMAEDFSSCRTDARGDLIEKTTKVKGKPLAIAPLVEDEERFSNIILRKLQESEEIVNQLNPIRMREKAKSDFAEKRARLQDSVSTKDVVAKVAAENDEELEKLRFAFNEADALVIKQDSVVLLKLKPDHSAEEPVPDNPGE